MSATEQMAQMLNELMGVKRNADIGDTDEPDFDEPDVCKNFLVAFCPNEMFRNTKADLGFCPKVCMVFFYSFSFKVQKLSQKTKI